MQTSKTTIYKIESSVISESEGRASFLRKGELSSISVIFDGPIPSDKILETCHNQACRVIDFDVHNQGNLVYMSGKVLI